MNAAKITLTSTILSAALGLALGLAPTAQADPADQDGCHTHKACDPSDGGSVSGKATNIVWTVTAGSSLEDDDLDGTPDGLDSSYFHSDGGVRTKVGGESQPNGPGISINLRGTGKNPRTIQVNANCTNPDVGPTAGEIFIGGVNGCDFLDGLEREVFGVQRAHMTLAARPYEVNCPGECLDVFTMGPGGSAQMGFQIFSDEGIRLDIASDIGGGSAPNPGRCLSMMSEDERTAFLAASCDGDTSLCNVTVTAMGIDSDGRNDTWDIVADGDTGLICKGGIGEIFVIGVATGVSFTIAADPEE